MANVERSVCARVTNGAGSGWLASSLCLPHSDSFVPPVWASDPAKRTGPSRWILRRSISAPTPPMIHTRLHLVRIPIPIKHRSNCHEVRFHALDLLKRRYNTTWHRTQARPRCLSRPTRISPAWLDHHFFAASETRPRQHVRRHTRSMR